MRYLPEIAPAGLLVIEPDELAEVGPDLHAGDVLWLLVMGELAQILRARALGFDRDPLALLAAPDWPFRMIDTMELSDTPSPRPGLVEYLAARGLLGES